ncbi:MAG: DNRLRE domain-containing protein [Tannerella sp.]|jgi:hypothetical protein|nr:DNRLRE domain-containing protein [Tannerella sp.]
MKQLFIILLFSTGLSASAFSRTMVDSRADAAAPWKAYEAEQLSDVTGYTPATTPVNKYGSSMNRRSASTGFFRTEIVDGRWYIIDPDGYVFIHKAVACVSPGTSERQKAALASRWGTNSQWCGYVNSWLKDAGFNGTGAWSSVAMLRQQAEPVAYTVIINPMSSYRDYHKNKVGGYTNAGWQGYEYNIIRVFDPLFETYMDNACKTLEQYKNDKYLLGYFVDNELPWVNDALDRHIRYLAAGDPCYDAAKQWLDTRKGKDAGLEDITVDDRNAFWDFYAGKYFKMAKDYILKYDPNHLFLGSRFNQAGEELSNPHIFETAGKYCDIISVNHYREWEPIATRMANWEAWSHKPFLITEFYTKGEDSGFANTTGAGWLVKTQRDRGLFYQNFVLKLLRSKGCVGWNWFRYQDNDPEDLTTDPSNRDSNKGMVNIDYDPYGDMMSLCKEINDNVYSLLEYLKAGETAERRTLAPVQDSYVRLLSSETDVHGSEELLRIKNDNASTYERTAFLQFDFTPCLQDISRIREASLGLKLTGIYPEASDPGSVILNLFRVTGMTFSETMTNPQLLSAYQNGSETRIGGVTVPVHAQSKDSTFKIDLTPAIPFMTETPVMTFRLQTDTRTATQFEFASRENAAVAGRPLVEIVLNKEPSSTAVKPAEIKPATAVWAYKTDANCLRIGGLEPDATVKLFGVEGRELYRFHHTAAAGDGDVNLPLQRCWGRLIFVNISTNRLHQTIKVLI